MQNSRYIIFLTRRTIILRDVEMGNNLRFTLTNMKHAENLAKRNVLRISLGYCLCFIILQDHLN